MLPRKFVLHGNAENSYEVISRIYEEDQSLIDSEVRDLDKILTLRKCKIKGLEDAKSYFHKEIHKRRESSNNSGRKTMTAMSQRPNRRHPMQSNKFAPDKFSRRMQYPPVYQNTRTVYNSPLLSKRISLNSNSISSIQRPSYKYAGTKSSQGSPRTRHDLAHAGNVHRSAASNKSLAVCRRLRSSVRRKMVKFERLLNAAERIDCEMNRTRKELIINEYKEERMKRTARILDEIESAKPSVVKELYKYKLDSILNHEEDIYRMKKQFREMLKDPRRTVAKIEKQKRAKKMILRLSSKNKYNP